MRARWDYIVGSRNFSSPSTHTVEVRQRDEEIKAREIVKVTEWKLMVVHRRGREDDSPTKRRRLASLTFDSFSRIIKQFIHP